MAAGARFDAWDDTFDNGIWLAAYAATGVDPDWYAHRERPFAELLPWDHIGLHLPRGYLERGCRDLFATLAEGRGDMKRTEERQG